MNLGNRINQLLIEHFGVKELVKSQADITQWFNGPLGKRIIAAQHTLIDKIMPSMYGYHLMQLSVLNDIELSQLSPVTHHFRLGVAENTAAAGVTRFEQLPIDADSIDVAVLHHVLEYSTNPHQLLRETARTIIPNGYLIIVGFNPWSMMSTKKLFGRLFTRKPRWRYHGLRRSRIVDWLQVLDFEPVSLQYGYHGLPLNRLDYPGVDKVNRWLLPNAGSFYLIVARKSITPMTVIKKPWKEVGGLPQWVKGGAVPGKAATYSSPAKKKIH